MVIGTALVHEMVKGLVVYSQLIPVTVLDDGQTTAADRERILEGTLIPDRVMLAHLRVVLIHDLPVLHDLLLAGEHRVVQLDRVVFVVEAELPDVKLLRSTLVNDCSGREGMWYLRGNCLANIANVGVKWLATHCGSDIQVVGLNLLVG